MARPLRVLPARGPLAGSLRVPGDKSIAHRALILNAVARGRARISGLPGGEDVASTVRALGCLGVDITETDGGGLLIEGAAMALSKPESALDCGNSGTTMRLLAGVLAGQPFSSVLDGDGSLRKRPMQRVATPLEAMGARIATSDGCAPIVIDPAAALHGLPGPFEVGSAQVKSAILLAALQARGPTCISQPLPSRDHTERMLRAMGVAVECEGDRIVLVGPALPLSVDVDVCGDISSAAFFVVAASLVAGSDVRLERVGLNPTRSGFLSILSRMGADIEVVEEGHSGGEPFGSIRVRSADLRATDIMAAEVPAAIDELPVLMVAAAGAEGVTRISGAAELRMKESDRISTMAALLGGLGVGVAEHADGLEIRGGKLEGGRVPTAGDHRVVMSAAVAALVCNGAVDIEDPGSAAISYPEFFEHLDKLRN